jgi:Ser/Thr protein kinase RdoA (MazF antagonist)
MPRELQHGDLWPDNVLRHAGGWQLIDFAEFGDVNVPLYDLWHMIRYRPRGRIARMRPFANRWDAVRRQLISSEMRRLQLSPAEIGATRLFYLVHMAAYRTRHGVAFQFAEEYTSAVAAAGEQFARGATLTGFSTL